LRLVSNTDHLSVLVLPYHLTLKRSVIVRSIPPIHTLLLEIRQTIKHHLD